MKYYGKIGYAVTVDAGDGVWIEDIKDIYCYGDVIRNSIKRQSGTETVNDNLNIHNRFSIVADAFAMSNFQTIKYIEWMGSKWKVSDVEVSPPRLILSIGGLYNE